MSLFNPQLDAVGTAIPYGIVGQVAGLSGLTIEAVDLPLPVGALCRISSAGGRTSRAEVIGFQQDRTLLMALNDVAGVSRGDRVDNVSAAPRIWVSHELLGRLIDGFGKPIDGKGELAVTESRRIDNRGAAPMDR